MKDYIFITKKVKLDYNDQEVSINELDIDDIIDKYSKEYIIDRENYASTVLGDNLIVTFKLKKRTK
ncbi:MAG: hypothetical protein P8H13_05935 [Polaribacter sp.]|nr:hypothetical protein [Polaribacter sp.]MDG1994577.1 hypothetical protein [Polaribacter sp.]